MGAALKIDLAHRGIDQAGLRNAVKDHRAASTLMGACSVDLRPSEEAIIGLVLVAENIAALALIAGVDEWSGSSSPRIISWRGHGHGVAVSRLQHVVGGQHQQRASAWASADSGRWTAIWSPSKSALKAVQTSGVQLDGLALDQDRLEGLNAQTVQRRCTVQQHGVLGDDLSSTSHTSGRRGRPTLGAT